MDQDPSKNSNNPNPLQGLDPNELIARGLMSSPISGSIAGWTAPTPEELADLIEGYEVVGLLGRGGMGAVYKVFQRDLHRISALKLLPLEVSLEPGFEERFLHEARAMARLSHPNIVTLFDFGRSSEGHLYYVMEYIDGTDLSVLIKSGGLDLAGALDVVTQICDALEYAHQEGYVHRDIKPANVLVDVKGKVKVTDFGLAKVLRQDDAAHGMTMTGQVMGTPDYMAPEQSQGGVVDHRADIYALGVMFYEMLTGSIPKGVFAPPSKKVHVDVRLDEVVLRALQQEPEQRYQQVSEIKTSIQKVKQPLSTPTSIAADSEKVAPAPTQENPPAKKKPSNPQQKIIIAVGAVAACILIALMGVKIFGGSSKHDDTAADIPSENAVPKEKVKKIVPPEAVEFGTNSYQLVSFAETFGKPLSWQEAREWCEEQGGHLATIASSEENTFLKNLFHSRRPNKARWDAVFLGGHDPNKNNQWEWVTGEPMSFTHWRHDQPNSAEEHCIGFHALRNTNSGEWHDISSFSELIYGFIIEWDNTVEPSNETVIWRRDWKGAGHGKSINHETPHAQPRPDSPEVGTHILVDFEGALQTFNHSPGEPSVGGHSVIARNQNANYNLTLELDQRYVAGATYTFRFVYGTHTTKLREGHWFLEFGTRSNKGFTSLTNQENSSFDTGKITTGEDENLNDDLNFQQSFGYNVGGIYEELTFTPPQSSIGKTIALRFGTKHSFRYAGFSDMMLSVDISSSNDPDTIPKEATKFGDNYYQVIDFRDTFGGHKTWHEAKAWCEQQGGHLATVSSEEECLFLTELYQKSRTARRGHVMIFLGGYDPNKNNQWEWITGEPFTYTYWQGKEPNSLEEQYLAITKNSGANWNDLPEKHDFAHGFIIEWEGKDLTKVPSASKKVHTNTLGMQFVPLANTETLFSVWETRNQDWQAFLKATNHAWKKPNLPNSLPEHPVTNISWHDANAFCKWLTEKERKESKLSPEKEYRLPSDAEWSTAIGLTNEKGNTPHEKARRGPNVYPWGTSWPPPAIILEEADYDGLAVRHAQNIKTAVRFFDQPLHSIDSNQLGQFAESFWKSISSFGTGKAYHLVKHTEYLHQLAELTKSTPQVAGEWTYIEFPVLWQGTSHVRDFLKITGLECVDWLDPELTKDLNSGAIKLTSNSNYYTGAVKDGATWKMNGKAVPTDLVNPANNTTLFANYQQQRVSFSSHHSSLKQYLLVRVRGTLDQADFDQLVKATHQKIRSAWYSIASRQIQNMDTRDDWQKKFKPVDQLWESPSGIKGLVGSAEEWVIEARGNQYKVLRGGCVCKINLRGLPLARLKDLTSDEEKVKKWCSSLWQPKQMARSAERGQTNPSARIPWIGFRPVLAPKK